MCVKWHESFDNKFGQFFGIKKVSYVYILVYISNDAALINSDRLKTWKGTKTTMSIEKMLKSLTLRGN